MNILFRVDGSSTLGTGHIMRCLALADVLKEAGAHITFLCMALSGNLNEWIEVYKGYPLQVLNPDAEDVNQTVEILQQWPHPIDWMIVDHYSLDAEWETAVRPYVNQIMVIDDLADRPHNCDVLLDQNFFLNAEARYAELVPSRCIQLLGPQYALLRPEFEELHHQIPERTGQIRKVLISFGGSDPTEETIKVLRALVNVSKLELDVAIGISNPNADAIQKLASVYPQVTCHLHAKNIAQRMLEADLYVGGGGTTTWERLALGLPAISIATAENQVELSQALAEAGYHLYLGRSQEVSGDLILQTLSSLMEQPALCRFFAKHSATLVDGRGCQRVAQFLLSDMLTLRPATVNDCPSVYAWRNHPLSRQHSLASDEIPWEVHQEWFLKSLEDPNRRILIGEQQGNPIGVLRYDLQWNQALVSVYLVPGTQGKGLGTRLLQAGSRWMQENHPDIEVIEAHVLNANIASQRAFEKAGYQEVQRLYRKAQGVVSHAL